MPGSHLQLEGFDLHRHDRTGKEGGGVALYIRKQWKLLHINRSPQIPGRFENKPEYLIVRIIPRVDPYSGSGGIQET